MVQTRTGTNFDIDAITRLVNADANVPAMSDQSITDPMTEALEAEAEDFETELQNPSSNRVDEAQRFMERPGAAKLSAGRLSAIQSGITVAETRNEFSFGSQRGDRILEEREKSEEKERAEKARAANVADDLNEVAERRHAEIERRERAEAWANTDHTYAGQKMSAEQWLRMIQWFKQPENRAAWEDAMMAETGQSRDRVRETAAKMDRLDALIEKEARGEVLSADEIAERDRLNRDRDVQQGMRVRRDQMELGGRVQPQVANQADAQAVQTSADTTSATATVNASLDVLAGEDDVSATTTPRTSVATQIEGRSEFITAPTLRTNFVAANAATTPLDQPSPQVIASAAPAAPVVAANAGGFDV